TVSAESDAELVRLRRAAVERLVGAAPETMQRLAVAIRRRPHRNALIAILPPLLGPLHERPLAEVEAAVGGGTPPRAEVLFRQGDAGAGVYVVVSGRLRALVRDPHGREKVVGEIQRGETVGEMALFTGEPRMATVLAVRDTELVRLDAAAFEALVAKCP